MKHNWLDQLRLFAGLAAAVALVGYGLAAERGISDERWLALLGLGWVALVVAIWPRLPKNWGTFSRSAVKTAYLLTSLFAVLAVQLVRIHAIDQDSIANRTGGNVENGESLQNPRTVDTDLALNRGSIYDRNGNLIAGVEVRDGVGYRTYPDPATAYVAGYYSPLQYGLTGLESTYDDELRGVAGGSAINEALNELLHSKPEGNNLILSLDSDLQNSIQQLLGDRTGAVVVLDIQTGATIALVSNPAYDPSQLVATTTDERDAAAAYWSTLVEDPDAPLVLRATSGQFTPGSTFKTVTAAAAIDTGIASPNDIYEDNGSLTVDGREIIENNRPDNTIDQWTLTEGYMYSLNVVFAQVGLQVGATDLEKYAAAFGFGSGIPYDLPVVESQLANNLDFLDSQVALAETSFGQGQILTSPLQMALIAACIANDGRMMQPYLVESIENSDGDELRSVDPSVWRTPVSVSTAQTLQQMMIDAVDQGSVGGAAVPGYTVGGKTGTAETGTGDPHSWFIGFIGDPEPRYAVSVVLEHGGGEVGAAVSIGQGTLADVIATN
ncbi:penicillin-binding protein 2 [soil metagenome]